MPVFGGLRMNRARVVDRDGRGVDEQRPFRRRGQRIGVHGLDDVAVGQRGDDDVGFRRRLCATVEDLCTLLGGRAP